MLIYFKFSTVCPLFASYAHECYVHIQITIEQEKLLDMKCLDDKASINIFFKKISDWLKEHDVELIQRIKAILPEGDQRSGNEAKGTSFTLKDPNIFVTDTNAHVLLPCAPLRLLLSFYYSSPPHRITRSPDFESVPSSLV